MHESDTRDSYDTVAENYATLVRNALTSDPYLNATLALFADLVGQGAPVADIGCGPGHVTAHLRDAGLTPFGIDLSPGMIEVARRDHPGLRFETGTMTNLQIPGNSLAGLVAFWSLIHIPDDEMPAVLAGFHRALKPGGLLLTGFHVGDRVRLKTEGYGGHPMRVHVHLRPPERMTTWLQTAGFTVEAQLLLDLNTPTPGAALFARKP